MSNQAQKAKLQLIKFAWISIGTAVATISLKIFAYFLTDSIGLLSDALESVVNLVTGLITLIAITIAVQPPDEEHAYGHSKAEYFSSGAEGSLILVAAIVIIVASVNRFIRPQPLQQIDMGIVVSFIAATINFVAARILFRAGEHFHSVALKANASHLMSDVWTSVGVILGVLITVFTEWHLLDPLIAIAVAIRIMISGWQLVHGAILGLMDTALPKDEVSQIEKILKNYRDMNITFHALRTRQSGRQRFVTVHIQVPGYWSVQKGHTLLEKIEAEIRHVLAPVSIVTHLEPIEDPASWEDIHLIRDDSN